jgi:uncharacterized protein YndB with AHSA1/START domain
MDVEPGHDVDIRIEVNGQGEIEGETLIRATPTTVFSLLTDGNQMATWLARCAVADAQPQGVFCLADPSGLRVEGNYLEVIPGRKLVFTWGGIEGLRPGQSIVAFALQADGDDTIVRLRHSHLSQPAIASHCLGWMKSGLPKLKSVAEGQRPRGTCLGDAAESREHGPYSTDVVW